MSTLWTPGGEHPVDTTPSTAGPSSAPDDERTADPGLDDEIAAALPEGVRLDDLSPEERARAEEMVREMAEARARLLETPAASIVANHGMGLYELGALHLSRETPDFAEATLAIDALAGIVDALDGRLGEAEATLREALAQLRMAFVQLKNQDSAEDA
jgi:Domain of unknown function (DUF1844)